MACHGCSRTMAAAAVPSPLLTIRHGYRAEWRGLMFTVESGSDEWTVRIEDTSGRALYQAKRRSAPAAQLAAVEFGTFQALGAQTQAGIERLNAQFDWRPIW